MQNIKEYVALKKKSIKEYVDKCDKKPSIVIIQVGDNPASCAYVKGKISDCAEVGIECKHIRFDESVSELAILNKIDELNADDSVTGFIVQLPLPKGISEEAIINRISPEKDVDGFSKLSMINPATPQGIVTYLEDTGFSFTDKNTVVIGRSNIVGKPIARMLLDKNCNVRQIHSKTSRDNKESALRDADIIIVATGHRSTLVDSDLYGTNDKCIIIDVGINRNENNRLCGDCEFVTVREKTPVPGGCGLLTRVALLSNLIKLYDIQKNFSKPLDK